MAILGDEPERRRFSERIEAAAETFVSAATLIETRIVLLARSGENAVLALDAFRLKAGIKGVEVTPRIADIAFDAYGRFGKGTGNAAALNYGDCFSSALARHLGAQFLFKGDEFSKTDVEPAG